MERAIAFAAVLCLVSLYALLRGGSPERSAATMYLVAYMLSNLVTQLFGENYNQVQWLVLGVDVVLLGALFALALKANRYWGIWAAAFQLIAVVAHLAKILFPNIGAQAFAITLLLWSYAVLPMLAVATYRHQARVSCFGSDPGWSV